ncbi:hypothetical protein BESB_026530 [Besnoitia besnoiti]|uniref:CS domain-containing protein n=1 Tax=Besnoitia besnoiti TaxID=94643 RepID=A0A2A9M138_BESBE|nr:uncharacterized protein BESB_026530 [Besnoitia besnoiti]PFH31679.1 hypothetical protein BESB_026530 [Besnoitia besnoiti]
MPIPVQFEWSQCPDAVVFALRIPSLSGSKLARAHKIVSPTYLRVSAPPYLFEVDLFDEIDDTSAETSVSCDQLFLKLKKKTPKLWKAPCASDNSELSPEGLRERRENSIRIYEQRQCERRKQQRNLKYEKQRTAQEEQWRFDREASQWLDSQTELEKARALQLVYGADCDYGQSSLAPDVEKKEDSHRTTDFQSQHTHRVDDVENWPHTLEIENETEDFVAGLVNQSSQVSSEAGQKQQNGHHFDMENASLELTPQSQAEVTSDEQRRSNDADTGECCSSAGAEVPGSVQEKRKIVLSFTSRRDPRLPARGDKLPPFPRDSGHSAAPKGPPHEKPPREGDPDWLRRKGDKLLKNGDIPSAMEAYSEALKLAPSARCFGNQGYCHLLLGKVDEADTQSVGYQGWLMAALIIQANAARFRAVVPRGLQCIEDCKHGLNVLSSTQQVPEGELVPALTREDARLRAILYNRVAVCFLAKGLLDRAVSMLDEALKDVSGISLDQAKLLQSDKDHIHKYVQTSSRVAGLSSKRGDVAEFLCVFSCMTNRATGRSACFWTHGIRDAFRLQHIVGKKKRADGFLRRAIQYNRHAGLATWASKESSAPTEEPTAEEAVELYTQIIDATECNAFYSLLRALHFSNRSLAFLHSRDAKACLLDCEAAAEILKAAGITPEHWPRRNTTQKGTAAVGRTSHLKVPGNSTPVAFAPASGDVLKSLWTKTRLRRAAALEFLGRMEETLEQVSSILSADATHAEATAILTRVEYKMRLASLRSGAGPAGADDTPSSSGGNSGTHGKEDGAPRSASTLAQMECLVAAAGTHLRRHEHEAALELYNRAAAMGRCQPDASDPKSLTSSVLMRVERIRALANAALCHRHLGHEESVVDVASQALQEIGELKNANNPEERVSVPHSELLKIECSCLARRTPLVFPRESCALGSVTASPQLSEETQKSSHVSTGAIRNVFIPTGSPLLRVRCSDMWHSVPSGVGRSLKRLGSSPIT